MADDIFGDASLFSEFERDRETQNIFIHFAQDESGVENRSRIVFRDAESDDDESDDEDGNGAETGMQVSQDEDEDPEAAEKNSGEDKTTDSGGVDVAASEEVQEEPKDAETNGEGQSSSAPQTTSYQEQFESILCD